MAEDEKVEVLMSVPGCHKCAEIVAGYLMTLDTRFYQHLKTHLSEVHPDEESKLAEDEKVEGILHGPLKTLSEEIARVAFGWELESERLLTRRDELARIGTREGIEIESHANDARQIARQLRAFAEEVKKLESGSG